MEVGQMAAQGTGAENSRFTGQQVTEHPARSVPGLPMLVLGILIVLARPALAVVAGHLSGGGAIAVSVVCALVLLAGVLVLRGLVGVVPGQARVVQLFGKYRGTIRESGLQWVTPFTLRIVASTRFRNQESAQLKVNDADGNPIEIAAFLCSEQATQQVVNTGSLYQ
jgi:regulator of protease activity HflC (stomatin/prohibitin superfamily)